MNVCPRVEHKIPSIRILKLLLQVRLQRKNLEWFAKKKKKIIEWFATWAAY